MVAGSVLVEAGEAHEGQAHDAGGDHGDGGAAEGHGDVGAVEAFADAGVPELAQPTVGPYSPAAANELLAEKFDPETLASRGYRNEQLDQLVIDTILGA